MSVIHLCVTMGTVDRFDRNAQLRHHVSLPWDVDLEKVDRAHIETLIRLAHAARQGQKLRGRLFDAIAEVGSMADLMANYGPRGDGGPYAFVTSAEVWTRSELEEYLCSLSVQEWREAKDLARKLDGLTWAIPTK